MCTRENTLSARISYKQFKSVADDFAVSTGNGLRTVYHLMDGRNVFKSPRDKQVAKEALDQLIKDLKTINTN